MPPHFEKCAEMKSIKTTFPRFFLCPLHPRYNPAFTKLPRPIPPHCRFSNRSPIRKNRPHLRHTKVAKTVEFSKSLAEVLLRATVLVLNASPKRYIHKIRIPFSYFGEEQFRLLGRRQLHKIHNLGNSETRDSGNSGNMRIILDLPFGKPVVENDCKRHKLGLSGRSGFFRKGFGSFAPDDFVPPVPSRFNVYFASDFHFSPFRCPFRFPCRKPIFRPFRRNTRLFRQAALKVRTSP